jgi:hypothetical protein
MLVNRQYSIEYLGKKNYLINAFYSMIDFQIQWNEKKKYEQEGMYFYNRIFDIIMKSGKLTLGF